ncbi:MAG: metallophosphoesterase family protein [Pseudolabrys sp.]
MSTVEPVELSSAGRVCPTDYVYSPGVFARLPDLEAETLYVVGGLYGNLAALAAVEQLAAQEMAPVAIVFNGDFHWFDSEPDWFATIERGVASHRALRGNVETEIARVTDIGAGCGCDYPPSVSNDVVWRSNVILSQLRAKAPATARTRLRDLPMHLVAEVAGLRVGIVHGDAEALAGWNFAYDALDNSLRRERFCDVRAASHIDVFASTHTCLAALRDFSLPGGRLTVINNGAAGMPNFAGARYGLISRIAAAPSPHKPLYGLKRDGVHIDAIPLKYDHAAFLDRFLAHWPEGSPAHDSYYRRIVDGPDSPGAQAAGR